jgi:hypothetical protein
MQHAKCEINQVGKCAFIYSLLYYTIAGLVLPLVLRHFAPPLSCGSSTLPISTLLISTYATQPFTMGYDRIHFE